MLSIRLTEAFTSGAREGNSAINTGFAMSATLPAALPTTCKTRPAICPARVNQLVALLGAVAVLLIFYFVVPLQDALSFRLSRSDNSRCLDSATNPCCEALPRCTCTAPCTCKPRRRCRRQLARRQNCSLWLAQNFVEPHAHHPAHRVFGIGRRIVWRAGIPAVKQVDPSAVARQR